MSDPKIGLALGGGAARGIAHIAMLEAFDELGVKPHIMAGASAGALFGAAYASGLSAIDIRRHTEDVLSSRIGALRHILGIDNFNANNFFELFNLNFFRNSLIEGDQLVRVVLPDGVARELEDCTIPFQIVTADFFGGHEIILSDGNLVEAVAASIAIPGAIAAPRVDDRILIDGACLNPVPFDLVQTDTDFTVAVDVTGWPVPRGREQPLPTDLLAGAMQLQQKQITQLKCERGGPNIMIVPDVDRFRVHDFFKVRDILKASRPAKEDLKRALGARIETLAKSQGATSDV